MYFIKNASEVVFKKNKRGRWRFDKPVESCAKREVDDPCEREPVNNVSLILVSRFLATISAALPFGARINGT
jgi:hypothetical protein